MKLHLNFMLFITVFNVFSKFDNKYLSCTVKLGYNEQLATGHSCSLKPGFVLTEFVIIEFHCIQIIIEFLQINQLTITIVMFCESIGNFILILWLNLFFQHNIFSAKRFFNLIKNQKF
jgi:hypothetical protein